MQCALMLGVGKNKIQLAIAKNRHWREIPRMEDWTNIYFNPYRAPCQERALVLAAMEINHRLVHHPTGHSLQVTSTATAQAQAQLDQYEKENKNWPPPELVTPKLSSGGRGALTYAYIILAVFFFTDHHVFGLDWLAAGKTQAGSICNGAWWRTLTALTLHGDFAHLIGNLVFGCLFGILLCHELGTGLAWFCILAAGSGGNFINAWVQNSNHTSVGASTAVFGAVGTLVALQWKRYGQAIGIRRWTPPIIGATILGYMGTAGERTDVMAHITGMLAGALFGLLLGTATAGLRLKKWQQISLAMLTPLLLVGAWIQAFDAQIDLLPW